MKRTIKMVLIVAVIAAMMTALFSCNIFKRDDTGSDDGQSSTVRSDSVFGKGVKTSVVITPGISDAALIDSINKVVSSVYSAAGETPTVIPDTSDATANEIVIGSNARDISSKAMQLLNDAIDAAISRADIVEEAEIDTAGFAIYAEGGSVAIVWSDDRLDCDAIEYFINNYFGGSKLTLEDGYLNTQVFSLLDYLEKWDEQAKADAWVEVESVIGTAATNALKNYYDMFDESYYLWLADLYDPETGGFYYSNSARDTVGYAPDIESTRQALDFLENSGMCSIDYSGWEYAIPVEMEEAIVAFAKSLQSSEDGFFYHPQWEKEDHTTTRLARDCGSATQILDAIRKKYVKIYTEQGYSSAEVSEMTKKYRPYWNAPNGTTGSLGSPGAGAVMPTASSLTGRLGGSTVAMVSKVIQTASSSYSSQLKTLDSWRAYLNSFDLSTSSYGAGNTIASLYGQISNREKQAVANGEPSGYIAMTKEYFDSAVYPSNGLWEPEVKYNSVNGLMKISSLYNSAGWEMKYSDRAFESAMTVAMLEGTDCEGKNSSNSVDVYNPFVAMASIIENWQEYSSDKAAGAALVAKYRGILVENAEKVIKGTAAKASRFAKDDGSFGYTTGKVQSSSQGMPVAVAGGYEGDVNGGNIAVTGILRNMCSVLGIDDIKPAIFGRADMEKFLRKLNSLGDIVKTEGIAQDVKPVGFEDDTVGFDSEEILGSVGGFNENREVVAHNSPTADNNHMLRLTDSDDSKGASVEFEVSGASTRVANCYILEFEIYPETITSASNFQIQIYLSYMLTLKGKSDGSLAVGDASSTSGSGIISNDFGFSLPAKEWSRLRIEYYYGDKDGVRTKIFLNDDLRYVSTNYYGQRTTNNVEPAKNYSKARIFSLSASVATVYLDNIIAERRAATYVDEVILDPDRINDFEGDTLSGGTAVSGGSVIADPAEADNNVLSLGGTKGSLTVTPTSRAARINTYVFEGRIYVPECSDGSLALIQLTYNSTSYPIFAVCVETLTEGDTQYAVIRPYTEDGAGDTEYARVPVNEWFTLRIEYYKNQYDVDTDAALSKLYVNGEPVAYGEEHYSKRTLPLNYTKLCITTLSSTEIYLDDIIGERDYVTYVDSEGNKIPDPDSTEYPKGGAGSSTEPDEGYDGRIDFEDCELGVPAIPGITTKPNTEYGNSIEIAKDPVDAANKVIRFSTKKMITSQSGNTLKVSAYSASAEANCSVLEFDMYAESGFLEYQIRIGSQYMLYLKQNGDTVAFTEMTASSGTGRIVEAIPGVSFEYGEWANIRIEYYYGTSDTVKIKLYLNGDLRHVSDNFYGKNTENAVEPSDIYDDANFYSQYNSAAVVYFDNIVAEKIKKDYVEEELWSFTGRYDFDGDALFDAQEGTPLVENMRFTETNEESNYFKLINDPTAGTSDAVNKVLAHKSVTGKGGSSFTAMGSTKEVADANCYLFEYDMYFDMAAQFPRNSSAVQINLGDSSSSTYYTRLQLTFTTTKAGEPVYITLSDRDSSEKITQIQYDGGWLHLRVEYYPEEMRYKIYFGERTDGEYKMTDHKATNTGAFADFSISNANNVATLLTYYDNLVYERICKEYVPAE